MNTDFNYICFVFSLILRHSYDMTCVILSIFVSLSILIGFIYKQKFQTKQKSYQLQRLDLKRSCLHNNSNSLMENGYWSDNFKMFDNLTHSTKWIQLNYTGDFQTKNCQKHIYKNTEIEKCFRNRRVTIFGDSRARTIYKVLKSRFEGKKTVVDKHFGDFPMKINEKKSSTENYDGDIYNVQQLNPNGVISYTWVTHFTKMKGQVRIERKNHLL